jgi:hypothetical protein
LKHISGQQERGGWTSRDAEVVLHVLL